MVSVTELLRRRPDGLQALAIDIPIGLMDGPRACDKAARVKLGKPRGSSVFPAPCRTALAARDYAESCQINQSHAGKKLTKQSWAIAHKIKEVDDAIMPEHQSWVFEVHPEVCFWHFAGGKPMQHKKSRKAGRDERIEILARYLPRIAELVSTRPVGVAVDDLLDAAVAALTARRRQSGEAARVCEPQQDARGLRVEIVY